MVNAKFPIGIAIALCACLAVGDDDGISAASRKETLLKRTGGRIEKPFPENGKVIAVVDAREGGGDGLSVMFAEQVRKALRLYAVAGSADDRAAFVITIVSEGDFVVRPEACRAIVPFGGTREETLGRLSTALMCLLASTGGINTQEAFMYAPVAAKAKGIAPYVATTYRQACADGWAPAPTNEYQKAIWDSFHHDR